MTQDTVRPDGTLPPPAPTDGWSLVLPLKPLGLAKSRLAPFAGPHRADLALSFALDTVAAALACPGVSRVLVVTGDRLAGRRLAALGAVVVADEPGGGLNAALAHGAAYARRIGPDAPLAALSADLPALRPAELARVLGAVPTGGRAFLADSPGVGTTLLACAPGAQLAPAFGGGSRARHAAGGAHEITLPDVPSVRRDVDTGEDFVQALALGVGPYTAAAAAALV
ncbi:2-phospho-L-lactate guanylyltransferase [Kitasatospora sp. NBC_00240]|uniref:2-phospho-L-lactate guanylyltransferase n=1 Tax=Kitasatospora sp. NBC_00240 TaxID=2903567 RepID=UPI002256A74A|nr:2-phospho-L-lactate guanylyltransferase [Kitasatospora sp. NBC_00240]MCX5210652.1 2-phospho-L-lactate guanylyltransferase [Kitasatospora sp. NBC_00240]